MRVPPSVARQVFARDKGCMAPRLGSSILDCWGRLRIEHVKDEPAMSLKAPPDLRHLLTLCQGHTEDGMKAGYVWCTDADNRAKCREYLRDLYPA